MRRSGGEVATALGSKMNETWIYAGVLWGVRGIIIYAVRRGAYERKGMFFRFLDFAQRSAAREGYFPQDWSSLPAGTPSGGRVGLRLELAWLGRAETPY